MRFKVCQFKYTFIALVLLLPLSIPGFCVDTADNQTLNSLVNGAKSETELSGLSLLEHHVFAQTFETEETEKRVSRLESTVFGDVQSGDINERQNRLKTIILTVRNANKPTEAELNQIETETQQQKPDGTEYPMVVALERKIIGRDFIYSPLDLRLNRLERKAFGRTFENKDYVDRVDKLLAEYPEVRQAVVAKDEYVGSSGSVLSKLPDSSSEFVGKSDTYKKLTVLEKTFFNQTYEEELITERLDRLERKAYGYALSGQSVSTRLNRLVSGFSTGYASKPKVRNQTSRTTVQNNRQNASQNISVGSSSAIAENTYRYSPEMVEMLPPDVKRDYYRKHGYPQSGSGAASTVIQNRSTVVLPNASSTQTNYSSAGGVVSRSTQYSGFQAYSDPHGLNQSRSPNQPMTYQSYSTSPYGSHYKKSRTQVYTAPGSTLTVTKEKYLPSQMPGYQGHPSVLQHLSQLEVNVYQRDFSAEPVPNRLARLEQALAGRVYPDFTDAERLNNLLKIYQYQSLARYLGQPLPNNGLPSQGIQLKIPLK